jgi:hypothetical protein
VYFNPHFETVLMHLDVISATFLHPGSWMEIAQVM